MRDWRLVTLGSVALVMTATAAVFATLYLSDDSSPPERAVPTATPSPVPTATAIPSPVPTATPIPPDVVVAVTWKCTLVSPSGQRAEQQDERYCNSQSVNFTGGGSAVVIDHRWGITVRTIQGTTYSVDVPFQAPATAPALGSPWPPR